MMFNVYEELDDLGQPRLAVGRGGRAPAGNVPFRRAGEAWKQARADQANRMPSLAPGGVPPHRHEAYEAQLGKLDAAVRALVKQNQQLIQAVKAVAGAAADAKAVARKAVGMASGAAQAAVKAATQARALVGAEPAPVTFTPREAPRSDAADVFEPETEGVQVSMTPPVPETIETDMEIAQAEAQTPQAQEGETGEGMSYYYDYSDDHDEG